MSTRQISVGRGAVRATVRYESPREGDVCEAVGQSDHWNLSVARQVAAVDAARRDALPEDIRAIEVVEVRAAESGDRLL